MPPSGIATKQMQAKRRTIHSTCDAAKRRSMTRAKGLIDATTKHYFASFSHHKIYIRK
jgi:hypothetical protein